MDRKIFLARITTTRIAIYFQTKTCAEPCDEKNLLDGLDILNFTKFNA